MTCCSRCPRVVCNATCLKNAYQVVSVDMIRTQDIDFVCPSCHDKGKYFVRYLFFSLLSSDILLLIRAFTARETLFLSFPMDFSLATLPSLIRNGAKTPPPFLFFIFASKISHHFPTPLPEHMIPCSLATSLHRAIKSKVMRSPIRSLNSTSETMRPARCTWRESSSGSEISGISSMFLLFCSFATI